MEKKIQFLGISGSLRKLSFNTMLLNRLEEFLPVDSALTIASIEELPFFNEDLDIPMAIKRPDVVTDFREKMRIADGVIIVSPEYNYSIPSVLKNAIDWASLGENAPISTKPIALMGVTTGQWGTVRMQLAFQPVFQTLGIRQVKPEILVANATEKMVNGQLLDEQLKKLITKQLAALKQVNRGNLKNNQHQQLQRWGIKAVVNNLN